MIGDERDVGGVFELDLISYLPHCSVAVPVRNNKGCYEDIKRKKLDSLFGGNYGRACLGLRAVFLEGQG